jgi:hypothetical protein
MNNKEHRLILGVVDLLLPVIYLAGRHFVSKIAVQLYIKFQLDFTAIWSC